MSWDASTRILLDECGFSEAEIKKARSDPDEARRKMRLELMTGCGLDPADERVARMVDAAFAGRDQLRGEAEPDAFRLEQVREHKRFRDVSHLLYAAEQERQDIAPYVMAAYLSEYLMCHLLLTGSYFCNDETLASGLKDELKLGRAAAPAEQPILSALRATLLEGWTEAVIGFCGLDSEMFDSVAGTIDGIADFWKLARQTAFFMTDMHAAYLLPGGNIDRQNDSEERTEAEQAQDVANFKAMVALGVYEVSDNVVIDDQKRKLRRCYYNVSWKDGCGFGDDLGSYNGQMPIKEFEVLAYRLVPYLMFKQLQMRSRRD